MTKSRLLILSCLLFVVSCPSYGSNEELAPIEDTKPVDSFQFLEQKGYQINGRQRRALDKTFKTYFVGDLQDLLEDLSQQGVLAKCTDVSQVNGILDTLRTVGQQGTFAQPMRLDITKSLAQTGVLAKCENGSIVNKVLVSLGGNNDMTCLALLNWLDRSKAVQACADGSEILALSRAMDKFRFKARGVQSSIMEGMANLAVFTHCGNLNEVLRMLGFARAMERRQHATLWNWLGQTRAMGACQSQQEVYTLLNRLESIASGDAGLLECLRDSEIFALCVNFQQVSRFLDEIKGLENNCYSKMGRKAYQKFENMEQVFEFIEAVKAGDANFRQNLEQWMGMTKPGKQGEVAALRALKGMEGHQRRDLVLLCRDNRIFQEIMPHQAEVSMRVFTMDMGEAERDLALRYLSPKTEEEEEEEATWTHRRLMALVKSIQAYTPEARSLVMSWDFEVPVARAQHSQRDHAHHEKKSQEQLKKDFLAYFENLDQALRGQVIAWLGRTAIIDGKISFLERCPIKELFGDITLDQRNHAPTNKFSEWLKSFNWFEKSKAFSDFKDVNGVVKACRRFSISKFTSECKPLFKNGLIDVDYIKMLFALPRDWNNEVISKYADPLLNPQMPLFVGEANDSREVITEFYVFLLSLGFVDKRINDYLQQELAIPERKQRTLELMVRELGKDHELTQQLLGIGVQSDLIAVGVNSIANRVLLAQLEPVKK